MGGGQGDREAEESVQPDGVHEIEHPDGVHEHPDGVHEHPDGVHEMEHPNGDAEMEQPNGDAEMEHPNGDAEMEDPNGDAEMEDPNGDAEMEHPNGDAEMEDPNGDAEMEHPRSDGDVDPNANTDQEDQEDRSEEAHRLLFSFDCEATGLSIYDDHTTEVAAKVVGVPLSSVSRPSFSSLVHTPRNIPRKGNKGNSISLVALVLK